MFKINNITKIFKGEKGIKNFSAEFKNGEVTGVLGNNGSGKSTLLKCIFKEYKADKIDATLNGEDISSTNVLKNISLLPDQSIFPSGATLEKFLVYNDMLHKKSMKEARANAIKYLKYVSLEDCANVTFEKLSSGMQKRALLALSLMNKPDFLFLDEPTANMDISTKNEMINLIMEIKKLGIGIVVSTHEISEWSRVLDKIIILNKGVKVYDAYVTSDSEPLKKFLELDDEKSSVDIDNIINEYK